MDVGGVRRQAAGGPLARRLEDLAKSPGGYSVEPADDHCTAAATLACYVLHTAARDT
jgi:hypothetical protein